VDSGEVRIESGASASISVDTSNAAINCYGTQWQIELSDIVNAHTPDSTLKENFHLQKDHINKRIELSVEQHSGTSTYKRRTIFKNSGLAKITASVLDENAGEESEFDWSWTDNRIAPNNGLDQSFIEFDPSGLTPGLYTIGVESLDSISSNPVAASLVINIVDNTTDENLNALDSEDIDDDGILDYADPKTLTNVIPMRSGKDDHFLASTEPGYTLALGNLAFEHQNNQASLTEEQIAEIVTNKISPDTPFESSDSLDIIVRGLIRKGDSAKVALPLSNSASQLFLYNSPSDTWHEFDTSSFDTVKTYISSTHTCYFPGSSWYQNTEADYHSCIELSIRDGGSNDADGLTNGEIAVRFIAHTYPMPLTTATPLPNIIDSWIYGSITIMSGVGNDAVIETPTSDRIISGNSAGGMLITTDPTISSENLVAQSPDIQENETKESEESSTNNGGGGNISFTLCLILLLATITALKKIANNIRSYNFYSKL
jgi:hypothetical protein